MRHTYPPHEGPSARRFGPGSANGSPDDFARRRRPFDYGALRLILLSMIAERPSHGYELMKTIEERMGGRYSPSPGVIYPTLAWLEDMGFATVETDGGRKSYRITAEGESFLAANRESLAAIAGRMGGDRRHGASGPVLEAMQGLKRALRARFMRGEVDPEEVARIAAALDAITRELEEQPMDNTETGLMMKSRAVVSTSKAAGYAAQLCKHFSHKVPARFEGGSGEIEFPFGAARLTADAEALTLSAEAADAAALARVEEVLASHLLRFAFREELKVEWQPA